MQEDRRDRSSFALTEGGPFYRLLVRLRVRTPTSTARCWWVGLVVWLPLILGEGARHLLGMSTDPIVFDLSLHARLLFALPVLLISEPLLDATTRSATRSLYRGNFCDPAELEPILERAERLRDSRWVELVLLATAILGGQLVLWRVFGTTGLFHGGEEGGFWSFPRLWYAMIALPLVQLMMFRWMWHWLIWCYVIARISRLRLSLLATHADFACGLGALARPITGFSAFVLACGGILASAWATQLLEARTTLPALLPMVVVFLFSALGIAIAPYMLLCGQLFRARRRTLAQYGDFVRQYNLEFHAKWIEPSRPVAPSPLGTPDIQSLNDLAEAFQVASRTRVFAFGPRNVLTVWFAGLLPMFPLLASTLTVNELFQRIMRTVLGGFPI